MTIADGFSKHPFQSTGNFTFHSLKLESDDTFEVGDAWYNITTAGKAYLFIKSTATNGQASFTYGKKSLFPAWVLIVIIVGSIVLGLACLGLCFCFIRRLYIRKRNNLSKV